MDSDSAAPRERDTLPPEELELQRVSEFESHARVNENDARLARLAELLRWGCDDE